MSNSQLSVYDVVILAGGLGTRLRSVIGEKQKVIAEVNKRPFLFSLLDALFVQGFRRVVLALGYQAQQVIEVVSSEPVFNSMEIVFSVENEPLGTAGGLRNAAALLKSEHVMVQNGDTFCDINYISFLNVHLNRSADISLAISKLYEHQDVGCIYLGDHNKIEKFNEKPNNFLCDAFVPYTNAGVYWFKKETILAMPPGERLSLEYDIFTNYESLKMYGFEIGNCFLDIGTENRFKRAHLFLQKGA